MRTKLTLFFIAIAFSLNAQTFTGAPGGILNNGQFTYFNLPVSGLGATLDSTFGLQEICINMNHPKVQQVYVYLQSPAGTTVELTQGASCSGIGYASTCFNNSAASAITLGTSPYAGSFKPVGSLGRFQSGQPGNGTWKLIVHDYLGFVDSGYVISWSLNFGTSPASAARLYSSNLPIVVINTGAFPLSDIQVTGDMGVISNGTAVRNSVTDPWNNYNGKVKVRFRGNSSNIFEKKPYALETVDLAGNNLNVSLLGMPPESDWILIAMYQDKSLARVPLTYETYRRMGRYAARFKLVEVMVNGEYQGVYALAEKPKKDDNRIDVSKLTATENALPELSGGYIIKIERTNEAGWSSLLPGDPTGTSHFYYQYVYPKDSSITIQQKNYIKGVMDDFETLMESPSYNALVGGYRDYIDTESFVDFFIMNELSKNVDAYRLSTFMYKDNISKGGKLHMGPVWDFDLAWHNCNYANTFDPTGWQYQIPDTTNPTPNWWNRFMQDTTFLNDLYCRWNTLRSGVLSTASLNGYVDSTAAVLNESQQRNFKQFPTIGTYIWPNPQYQVGATYGSEISDLKNWITSRAAWMDGAITGQCILSGIAENDNNSLIVYPNPFETSTTFHLNLKKDANVSLRIIDVMGKEVALLVDEHKAAGETELNFDRGKCASGIYFYQLKINNSVKAGKMIIR